MAERKELNYTTGAIGSGLAGLLTGIRARKADNIAQAQLENQTQQTAWNNPYRPISELDIAKKQSNPLYQALAQLIGSAPNSMRPPVSVTPSTTSQPAPPTATAPVWSNWTGEDFMGFKDEMKKRGLA